MSSDVPYLLFMSSNVFYKLFMSNNVPYLPGLRISPAIAEVATTAGFAR